MQSFPGQREDRGVLGLDGEDAVPVVGILEAIKHAPCGAITEHGLEERLADHGEPDPNAAGFPVVRLGQRVGAVGFHVPANIRPVLVRDGIGEGKPPGIRAVEGNVDGGVAGEMEDEFGVAHVLLLLGHSN
uniref:Uncharacterized protein n=2 Tax=Candidatus Kentrum sp. SD TaxID=2126332 RepID=A0A450YJS4_9GAMM|nr:MAG: hypothetical protein BECKSD772F_GA0070984_11046 [Candidatus Kentron sp. SD]